MKILLILTVWGAIYSMALWLGGHHSKRAAMPAAPPPPKPRRILIVGASGGTGRHLVSQALERGYEVTALVRNRARLPLEHERLRVVVGDLLDPSTADAATQGQDAVLSALGHRRYYSLRWIVSRGTQNLIEGMRRHGVRRFIAETTLGLGDAVLRTDPFATLYLFPLILPIYFWDKIRQERLIGSSELDWIIVRPGRLTDRSARGRCRAGVPGGWFLMPAVIPRADVATFMLDQLESNQYLRTAVGIC